MTQPNGVQALLGLDKPPIAVGFFDAPPPVLTRWEGGPVPAGCAFWREAQQGRAFYTVPEDHYNCAVGAYTHGLPLPAERADELNQTVGFMVGSNYLRMEEVPGIPTLKDAPAVIAYAPVAQNAFPPSAVLVAAQPAQAMALYEAVLAAGAADALMNVLGRPGCAVLPLAGQVGTALSFGCQGNRTFTGLPDSEMYVCIPGAQWEAVAAQVASVVAANDTMGAHYRAKKHQMVVID